MQIYTIEDIEFPKLLAAWSDGRKVARYQQGGLVILVAVTNQYVLVGPETDPKKLAVKPVRTLPEAEDIAKKFIDRERERGSSIEVIGASAP